jgi:hypothetical protein
MNDRLRDLFAVPPAEFVAARDALAKELRASGHDAQAKEVSSLRRPAAPVWAVNQLARRAAADLEALLESSERVRRAQGRGATGGELRAAMAEQRAALSKLESGAEQVLRGAGLQASPGVLRTVQSTLQAAATGADEVREGLRSGTMREALEPTGFEALLGGHPPAGRETKNAAQPRAAAGKQPATSRSGKRAAPDGPAARAEAAEAKRRARQHAREERQRVQEQALAERRRARDTARLERKVRQLEARAESAERAANEARAAAESARADLQRLRS